MKHADKLFDTLYSGESCYDTTVPATIRNDIKNIYNHFFYVLVNDETIDEIYNEISSNVKKEIIDFLKTNQMYDNYMEIANKIIDIAAVSSMEEIKKRLNINTEK